MTVPPELHPDEPNRLESLRAMNIMDTPLEERFERITRLAQRMLGVDIVAISLVEADRQFFKSVVGLDVPGTSRDVSFCGHTILQSGIMEVPDARLDPRFAENPLVTGNPNIVFYAAHPLCSIDGHNVGSLCVIDSNTREFNDDDRQILLDLAALAESELQAASANAVQAALLDEVTAEQRRGMVDSLTRVWNREGITRLAEQTLERVKGGDEGAALIGIDLDKFKYINDTYGHAAGDTVLSTCARRMLGAARESDLVGRVGGDEFLIILASCESPAAANAAAQRICDRISGQPVKAGDTSVEISASLGVAYLEPGQRITLEAALEAADKAMYTAKQAGRNAVSTAPISDAA